MRVVVVGGGISGLVAAYRLLDAGADVVLLEADDRAGGKILTTPFAGLPAVDCGADAFLARVPNAVELCRELGFGDELISPATGNAYIWTNGALRPVPTPNFLGVPLDAETLRATGIVDDDAVDAIAVDLARTVDPGMPDGDESLGSLVRRRLGDQILERLVDPLLGGIYAGDSDRLSLEAGAPQIAAAARRDASLVRALRNDLEQAAAARPPGPPPPVFFAPPDGMSRLVRELERRLGERVNRGCHVSAVERDTESWVVDGHRCDAVVLATPAFVTAQLLRDVAPQAAAIAASIEYAGVVLVTFAFERRSIARPLDASGFLVPKTDGRLLTACSWASTKWPHLGRDDRVVLRASAGHVGDEHALALDDDVLVSAMLDELAESTGVQGDPIDVRIARWPRSFPQYTPGHLGRVDALDAHLAREAPGVTVVGAAYRGVGIPACVAQASRAAAALLG
ncbi:MAG TPA: protoporphyrinogen oxidase [Acidimicrobiales bacterium]